MIPIRRRLYQSLAGFTPRVIFAALQGAWYEAGLNGTLFTTHTGETAASAESTVGLALDKSRDLVLGPELVTNGDFSNGTTGWLAGSFASLSIEDGKMKVTATQTNSSVRVGQILTVVVGKTYIATSDIAPCIIREGTFPFGLGTNQGRVFTANTTTASVFTGLSLSAGQSYFVDNISVREVLGNHASQSTAANRPVLKNVGNTWFLRHDTTDALTASLPALSGGNFSTNGSVYFATNVGMSALHGLTIGTSYNLPALSTDVYGSIIVPERLSAVREAQLERYFLRLAGLAEPDYLTDDAGKILMTDSNELILRQ